MSESPNRLQRIIDWLRVDTSFDDQTVDHVTVMRVLRPHLSDDDIETVVASLAEHPDQRVSSDEIRAHLAETANERPTVEDIQRVSERLAAAGIEIESEEPEPDTEAGPLARIVAWLREGYPTGVPEQDYVPLLALLRRRLTDKEVKAVSKTLRKAGIAPAGVVDISNEIIKITHELPSKQDIMRVHARLAKKGWPVEFPDPD